MNGTKVEIQGETVVYEIDPLLEQPLKKHALNPGVGKIIKIEQHYDTVYVQGIYGVRVILGLGLSNMMCVHEYSHHLPTWMKQDLERFKVEWTKLA